MPWIVHPLAENKTLAVDAMSEPPFWLSRTPLVTVLARVPSRYFPFDGLLLYPVDLIVLSKLGLLYLSLPRLKVEQVRK
jgi:hypothetical protein